MRDALEKVEGVGSKIAVLLKKINIDSPEKLADADAKDIEQQFSKKKETDPGAGYWKPAIKTIEGWIASAKNGSWKYSFAYKRIEGIKQRIRKFKEKYDEDIVFDIDQNEFEKFYKMDDASRCCKYCGISENDIDELRSESQIKTVRFRGVRMEVDRKDPSRGYICHGEDCNLALACYWCNNAKTDEFTAKEFQPIADGIKKVWKERLDKIKGR